MFSISSDCSAMKPRVVTISTPGKQIAFLLHDPQRRDARIDCRAADRQLGRGWQRCGLEPNKRKQKNSEHLTSHENFLFARISASVARNEMSASRILLPIEHRPD